MGNCGNDREIAFDPDTLATAMSGIGTQSTLPMSDEEKAAADAARRPIGFIWSEE